MYEKTEQNELIEKIREGTSIVRDQELEKAVFESLKNNSVFKEYLLNTMANDMKRYFMSPKEQQDLIKGHYAFAQYLYNRITKDLPK